MTKDLRFASSADAIQTLANDTFVAAGNWWTEGAKHVWCGLEVERLVGLNRDLTPAFLDEMITTMVDLHPDQYTALRIPEGIAVAALDADGNVAHTIEPGGALESITQPTNTLAAQRGQLSKLYAEADAVMKRLDCLWRGWVQLFTSSHALAV